MPTPALLGVVVSPGGDTWTIVEGQLVRQVNRVEKVVALVGPGVPDLDDMPFRVADHLGGAARMVEVDSAGALVPAAAIAKRGRLAVGRQLLEEQRRREEAGLPEPALGDLEIECLCEAVLELGASDAGERVH